MPGRFPLPNQATVFGIPGIFLLPFPYGTFTLFGAAFQRTSGQGARKCPGPTTPHLYLLIAGRFGLPCAAFPRRYSRHRYCFLFLPLLRCFTSGGSLSSRSGPKARIPIQRSQDRRPHAPTLGLSQLARSFFGSGAKPSTKWRSIGRNPLDYKPMVVSSIGFIKTVRSSFFSSLLKSSTSTLHSLAAVRELHVASKVSFIII